MVNQFNQPFRIAKVIFSLVVIVILISSVFTQIPRKLAVSSPPIPRLAEWENNMQTFGRPHCARLQNYSGFDSYGNPNGLAETYYDAQNVFQRLAAYTGDATWLPCAAAAERIYRDGFVLDSSTGQNCNGGFCAGYWNFTDGLRRDFVQNGDLISQQANVSLSRNAAFARDNTPEDTSRAEYSREVSYAILSYLNAEEVGEPRRPRLALLINQSLGHFDQWFVSQTYADTKPFIVGLSAQALIRYWEKTGDNRILPKIRLAADSLWNDYWVVDSEAFIYEKAPSNVPGEGRTPAPDLNLLIAPLYAWLYHQTGNTIYQIRGDAIFAGGVRYAYLGGGKQFDQNYRWSDEFVRWRTLPPMANPVNRTGDFDGDGRTDIGVFRPASGSWYSLRSSDNQFSARNFGFGSDILTPGDYDGDGRTDIAVFRPSNGFWYYLPSGSSSFRATAFGQNGDIPVIGDFDGDGKDDFTVYRPNTGFWYSLRTSTGQMSCSHFGASSDLPIRGDFDGDGLADIAVFRPSTGFWFIRQSATGTFRSEQFGQSGDILVPNDFDGDGKTDLAVFRNGWWFIRQSSNRQLKSVQFGLGSDLPVAGDYDGDGQTDVAVYRSGTWFIRQSATSSMLVQQFGAASDAPLPAAFSFSNNH